MTGGDQPGRRVGATRPLAELLERFGEEGRLVRSAASIGGQGGNRAVTGIADDSRAVEPGNLFAAIAGLRVDGHDFVADAIARGAASLILERTVPAASGDVVRILVDSSPKALASAAAWWQGDPSHELTVVGVTGTNGKTTTTFMVEAALEAIGWPTGLVGTLGRRLGGELQLNDLPNTTPGAIDLQATLRAMVGAGERAVVIETSSHALAQERVASVAYDAAVFTNLSHEHLDVHGTFEAYRAAKLSLFERLPRAAKDGRPGLGVVNADDGNSDLFAAAAEGAGARVVRFGTGDTAEVRLLSVDADASSSRLVVDVGGRELAVNLRVGARYNARNALGVLGLAHGWDLDLEAVAAGLASLRGVPGRLEAVDRGQPFHVVVDFAHTPGSIDAVAGELATLAEPHGGGVISVFGASGERDVGKRPLMGEAGARHSRLVVVTEDDPRSEDPDVIAEEVARGAEAGGARRGESLLVIGDRREAIAEAFRRARPGDVVLLAGKGHERSMMRAGGPEPWNDRDVAEELLAEMGFASR
jgi:UDP-N-acetylmuramoyl-L-alanyl-D-glutamate--2,6-diaminopimelate ligase